MKDYKTQRVIDEFFRKEKKAEKQKKRKSEYNCRADKFNHKRQKKQKKKSKVRR